MATTPFERREHAASRGKELISFDEAMEKLSRDGLFHEYSACPKGNLLA
jgi:hypothetical protein